MWEQLGPQLRTAAQGLGVSIFHVELIPSSYGEAFALIAGEAGEAILASSNGAHFVNRRLVADMSITRRLPGLFTWRDVAEAGALVAPAADYSNMPARQPDTWTGSRREPSPPTCQCSSRPSTS